MPTKLNIRPLNIYKLTNISNLPPSRTTTQHTLHNLTIRAMSISNIATGPRSTARRRAQTELVHVISGDSDSEAGSNSSVSYTTAVTTPDGSPIRAAVKLAYARGDATHRDALIIAYGPQRMIDQFKTIWADISRLRETVHRTAVREVIFTVRPPHLSFP